MSYIYHIIIKHMKKFIVTETIPATVEYTYYVEAENEEQALDMVMNGDAEETATMRWVEEGDGEWEVEEEK
jgi:hypothetical protein